MLSYFHISHFNMHRISSIFTGKSIVLEHTKDESKKSKAKIKRQHKQGYIYSNKNVKKLKVGKSRSITFSSGDINTLHRIWLTYMRKILKSSSGDQLLFKASQIELIGAEITVVYTHETKFKGLNGYIVDTSKSLYTVAVLSGVSSKYRSIRIPKKTVSIALTLPHDNISKESSVLILNGLYPLHN